MKTTQPLFWNKWMRNGRKPARPPLRFTECKKLELKDRVTSSTQKSANLACNSQMMEMMSCLKENAFDQVKCVSQINSFKKCYQTHLDTLQQQKASKNEPIPGQNRLTIQQANALLKRYPQPR